MTPVHDSRPQLVRIDEKIIELIDERMQLCIDLEESGDMLTRDEEADIINLWLEEAADRELDEALMEKAAKVLIALSRKAAE